MPEADITKHERQWKRFVNADYALSELSPINKKITKTFLKDFEIGINVPKQSRGKRTPATLLKLRWICIFLSKQLGIKDFTKMTKTQIHKLFKDMIEEKILKDDREPYRDIGDFVKNTKTFWGWMLKTKRVTQDITEDLSRASYKKGKPDWTYLTHEQLKTLIDNARGDYRALIMFLYDSGARPSEAYRLRVGDIQFKENETLLTIPERRPNGSRVSKTFERTIRLKNCSAVLKSYIELNKLKSDDLLIIPAQPTFNKYLRELALRLFGSVVTKARGKTDELKLYDIRHMAAIYWLDKYRTHKDLMYRMGWAKEDKILYYSEFLGRRDKIDDEDMLTAEDKSRLETDVERLKKSDKTSAKRLTIIAGIILNNGAAMKNLPEKDKKELIALLNEE